jgi:death-on-curing protein
VAFAVVDVFLRINGYWITADSVSIYRHMLQRFDTHSFDMEHLVPWLQEVVALRAPVDNRKR